MIACSADGIESPPTLWEQKGTGGAPWQAAVGTMWASETSRTTSKVSADDAVVVLAPDRLMSSGAAYC